jgi:hypothetical protein
MKIKNFRTISFFILLGFTLACNKSKRYTNRLDGNKWKVVSITVNGLAQGNLPVLLFKDCDIYKESCKGTWISDGGGRAQFVWQFRENGKVLEISNQSDHAHTLADVKAGEQCIEYTGVYDVLKSKRKFIALKSTTVYGHPNNVVEINLDRAD